MPKNEFFIFLLFCNLFGMNCKQLYEMNCMNCIVNVNQHIFLNLVFNSYKKHEKNT